MEGRIVADEEMREWIKERGKKYSKTYYARKENGFKEMEMRQNKWRGGRREKGKKI